MRSERDPRLSPRMQRAVQELKDLVQRHYPAATFRVTRDPEAPRSIDLLATIDVEDRQAVLDVVRERVLQFQLEEKLPVHVIPLHTPAQARTRRERRAASDLPLDLLTPLKLPAER